MRPIRCEVFVTLQTLTGYARRYALHAPLHEDYHSRIDIVRDSCLRCQVAITASAKTIRTSGTSDILLQEIRGKAFAFRYDLVLLIEYP